MAIQFNQLPGGRPQGFPVPPKGQYIAVISKAEMKQPKDQTKDMYLSMVLDLTDDAGKSHGKVFDIISSSDNEYIRFKLKRLIEALELPITGSFELKDLTKMVPGKKLRVDITVDDRGDQPKAVVDIFSNEIFYPLEASPAPAAPIQAPDALDDEIADVFGGPANVTSEDADTIY